MNHPGLFKFTRSPNSGNFKCEVMFETPFLLDYFPDRPPIFRQSFEVRADSNTPESEEVKEMLRLIHKQIGKWIDLIDQLEKTGTGHDTNYPPISRPDID